MQNMASFFDDDDANIVFEFSKPEAKHQKDLSSPAILKNILMRRITYENHPQQGIYALHNTTLAYYKNGSAAHPDLVLSLAHSRLNALPANDSPLGYGFSVTKNGKKYEFYSIEEQLIQNWITALKNVCILTNFHEEYRANKMIGKGSFAKVYLVESKTTNKNYAVKAFTKESVIISNKANAKPCMINEIDLMRGLDHENVIKLYEVYETEKSIYLVLELIQGKSLQEVLKKASFKDNEARTINVISSILEALAYLASKGIMHRDLKPDNILLDKGDKVKIVDFGLATFVDLPEYIFKKCGTPGYIAPEVFKYDPKIPETGYNHSCDVFSAGCILFFMLFGIPFFDGPNASEILKSNRRFGPEFQATNIVKQELKNPNSRISKEALQMLLLLLEYDQKKRVSASKALTHSYVSSVVQQKIAGSYDVYQYGGYSPTIHDRRTSLAQEQMFQQNKVGSPNNVQKRFVEKDSLYLDLGKPELNGKVDTLTSGSANNSLLLQKAEVSVSSSRSASPYINSTMRTSSFKAQAEAAGSNQFYKAALVRNMHKNQEEEENKNDSLVKNKSQDLKHERRRSDFIVSKASQYKNSGGYSERRHVPNNEDYDDDEETDDISNENPQLQKNLEKILRGSRVKHPSKLLETAHLKRSFGWPSKGL